MILEKVVSRPKLGMLDAGGGTRYPKLLFMPDSTGGQNPQDEYKADEQATRRLRQPEREPQLVPEKQDRVEERPSG